jgi:hypothetical protein
MEVLTIMTPAQMDGMYAALVTADANQDAEALARLCWQLYEELRTARERAEGLKLRIATIAQISGMLPPGLSAATELKSAGTFS